MTPTGTLMLTRHDITTLMRFEDYLQAAEQAFRCYAEGHAQSPGVLHIGAVDGAFHIKAAGLEGPQLFIISHPASTY
jgi:hypothetical protein